MAVDDSLVFARSRSMLPFSAMCVGPGERVRLMACPQRLMLGPFWLAIANAEYFSVEGLQFGISGVFEAKGRFPGLAFDARRLEKLVPFECGNLVAGTVVALTLINDSAATLVAAAGLYGRRLESSARDDREMSGRLNDRVATMRALERYELGDAWETPSSES